MSKRTNSRNSTRYNTLKELYLDFLIIEIKKDKLKSYKIDYYLLRYIKDCVIKMFNNCELENIKYYLRLHNINYVIIDSYSEVEIEEFDDNQYEYFKHISVVYYILMEIDKKNRNSMLIDWTKEELQKVEQLHFEFFEG